MLGRYVNLRGDLFATTASFGAQSVIKLASSLVLTRILQPAAYGIITVLISILFAVEMLSDVAVTVSVVRHARGDDPNYLHTAWTLRLIRAACNFAIVYLCAPSIAALYATPDLTLPLRVFSLWFLISAIETMSFPLAIRRKNARIIVWSELLATTVSTLFSLAWSWWSRDYWGMLYGTLLNRLMMAALSYCFYRDARPRLTIDREAMRELLSYARFAMPSSMLTLALSQFDKLAFLRLFDLRLLGVYSLAGNIAGPIESLITKVSQLVLYPRCAHNYRTEPATFAVKYYSENRKVFASMLLLPAAVGGAAPLIIAVLYDPRYAQAGVVLQAFMLRASLLSLAATAEDMLIASGESRLILVGNIFRALWMIGASLLGYAAFGFMGFVYGTALSGLPPLLYYLRLQQRKGMLVARYELYRVGIACATAAASLLASTLLLAALPLIRTRA